MITRKNILDLKTRSNIYLFVQNNPGLHFRDLERKMDISDGTLKYHLDFLEKQNLISTENTGRYKNYFVRDQIGRKDKKILSLLQKEMYRNIILYLFVSINSTRDRIIIGLDLFKHPNTVSHHLKKLIKLDVIEKVNVKNGLIIGVENNEPPVVSYSIASSEILYRLKDPDYIYKLLITYKDKINEDPLLNYLLELMDYREKYGYPKIAHMRSNNEHMDIIFSRIYDIFPHPYHV